MGKHLGHKFEYCVPVIGVQRGAEVTGGATDINRNPEAIR
jgi:hypothetical protein